MDLKRIGVAIFSGVTLGLLAVSIGNNYWIVNERSVKGGLWGLCVPSCIGNYCSEICVTYTVDQIKDDEFHAVRAFACIAVFLATVGWFTAVLRMCKELNVKLAAGCFLGAGICMIIALSIYTNMTSTLIKLPGAMYGWCYILGWISSILCFTAMIVNWKCSN